jgi:hypothetical protein
MASEYIDVQGKVMFIHAVNFNKYDKWSITLRPTQASLEIIRDLQAQGIKNVMKKDDNGYYIQFSREPTKLMRGKVVAFAAPKCVQLVDGKPELMDGSRIGHDSDVTVRLEVYQHGTPNGGKAKAARWDSIRVDNLIPWDPDKDLPEMAAAEVKDLAASPQPMW